MHKALAATGTLFLAGCATLAPSYREPPLPVVDRWPIPAETAAAPTPVADIGWRDFVADERLEQLIARALESNRDLRIAVLNVQRVRGLYRIQRADRLPTVGVGAQASRQRQPDAAGGGIVEQYGVDLGIAAFELDFFGRVRNLSEAALQSHLAQEQTRRTVQLALIADVARAWVTLAADRELLRLAEQTLAAEQRTYELIVRQHDLGRVSGLVLHQARTTVARARVDVARYAGNVEQDVNAVSLLVGGVIEDALQPDGFDVAVTGLHRLPPGLPSQVLLRRPDVLAAEHALRAAHANIGAARAAFFPSIQLTGAVGTASADLDGLFQSGSQTWSFVPRIDLPIFDLGRRSANLAVAKADRDIALNRYDQAIQTGFREVSDALALTRTLAEQREAQAELAQAAESAYELSRERFRAGLDSFLNVLDSQRTWYAAQQDLISTHLAEAVNRISLYSVLGGGWQERNEANER